MTPARWDKVKSLFDGALRLEAEERASYLRDGCAGDAELYSEVDRLLREFDQAGGFLKGSPLERVIVERALAAEPGEVLAGRYRILRLLGQGGMGEVYEADDQLLGERVALKTLKSGLARDPSILQRFQKEMQLARKVTHPNVCRIFEVGVDRRDDRPPLHFFTMELLEGETLAARIRRLGRMTRDRAFPIARQMAEGLAAAHRAGVVHRDFKSGNVMLVVTPSGDRAVITDFGLAHLDRSLLNPDETASMTGPGGALVGTVAYMSPEQLAGGLVTALSDIYSFGIVLFEMATGRRPFDDQHLIRAAVERASGTGPPLRSLAPDIDSAFEAAILRCLQRDPKRRFPSAAKLADWFRDDRFRLSAPRWNRRQWTVATAGGGAALAAGGGLWAWTHQPYQPTTAAEDWYKRGTAALHSMAYEAARKALEKAVAADPRFALAHARLSQAYEELDQSEHAKDEMLKALAASEETRLSREDARRLEALRFVASRDFDRAAPLFGQLEKQAEDRDKAAAALESGWATAKRGDNPSARKAYQRALMLDPGYAAAQLRLAVITQPLDAALKGFGRAEDLYSAASDYEGLTETFHERALRLNRAGRFSEALAQIDKGLRAAQLTDSLDQQIRLLLEQSVAFRRLEDTRRATEVAAQAVQTAIDHGMEASAARGLIDLGNAFWVGGELPSAEGYFRRALEFAQRSKARQSEARARLSLGSLFVDEDRPGEAKPFIQAAIPYYQQADSRREIAQAHFLLAEAQAGLGELEAGERSARTAIETADQLRDDQVSGEGHYSLGVVLRNQGRWPEALNEFETSARLHKGLQQAEARLECGEIYWRLGRAGEARTAFDEVEGYLEHSQDPQSQLRSDLLERRAEQAYGLGSYGEALRLASNASQGDPAAMLFRGLAQIRSGPATKGIEESGQALEIFRRDNRAYDLASAQLLLAEALIAAKRKAQALDPARQALSFFSAMRIAERTWRANWAMAQADPGEREAHLAAARSALDGLRNQWPAADFEGYTKTIQKSVGAMSSFESENRVLK